MHAGCGSLGLCIQGECSIVKAFNVRVLRFRHTREYLSLSIPGEGNRFRRAVLGQVRVRARCIGYILIYDISN